MLPAGPATAPAAPHPQAEEFVRFCYGRRRVGWPELYDEMCAVASRGLFRGMGHGELAEIGIGFSLFETPRLAELVHRLVADEQARRMRARHAAIAAAAAAGVMEAAPTAGAACEPSAAPA